MDPVFHRNIYFFAPEKSSHFFSFFPRNHNQNNNNKYKPSAGLPINDLMNEFAEIDDIFWRGDIFRFSRVIKEILS